MCFSVSSGSDAILLGAETLRGLYPVETISTVGKICAEVSSLLFSSNIPLCFISLDISKKYLPPLTHVHQNSAAKMFVTMHGKLA